MKKIVIISLILLMGIILSFGYAYSLYSSNRKEQKQYNSFFEEYKNKRIYGSELATIMNKVMDQKQENSIQMEIHISDNDTIYNVEQIYNLGTERFVANFNTEQFECTKIEYNFSNQKVNYILFEQVY